MPDAPTSSVGTDRHPRDLRGLVETMHVGEEAHDLASFDGDETGITPDGGRTVPPALLLTEVIREAGDDRIAGGCVVRLERADLGGAHPPRAIATRSRATRSAAVAGE